MSAQQIHNPGLGAISIRMVNVRLAEQLLYLSVNFKHSYNVEIFLSSCLIMCCLPGFSLAGRTP